MPLNFGNAKQNNSEYFSQFVGSELPELVNTANVLQKDYNTNLDKLDNLQALENSIQTLGGDKQIIADQINNTRNLLTDYTKKGNYENSGLAVRQAAKDFVGNKAVKAAQESYGNRQKELALQDDLSAKGIQYYDFGKGIADNHQSFDPTTGQSNIYRSKTENRLAHEDEMDKLIAGIQQKGWETALNEATNIDPRFKKAFLESTTYRGVNRNDVNRVAEAILPLYLSSNSGVQLSKALQSGLETDRFGNSEDEILQRLKESGEKQIGMVSSRQFQGNPLASGSGSDKWDGQYDQLDDPYRELPLNNINSDDLDYRKRENYKAASKETIALGSPAILSTPENYEGVASNLTKEQKEDALEIGKLKGGRTEKEQFQLAKQHYENLPKQGSGKYVPVLDEPEKKEKGFYIKDNIQSFQVFDPQTKKLLTSEEKKKLLKSEDGKDNEFKQIGNYSLDNVWSSLVPEESSRLFATPKVLNVEGKNYIVGASRLQAEQKMADRMKNVAYAVKSTGNPIKVGDGERLFYVDGTYVLKKGNINIPFSSPESFVAYMENHVKK